MDLTMTDVGVRVIEMRDRSRRSNVPTVLGRKVKERAWPLRHLDFSTSGGEIVFILDIANDRPALFLRLATGLLQPDEGEVVQPHRSILAVTPRRRTIGSLSVGQIVRLTAGMYGLSDRTIARRFDEMVDFAEVGRLLHRPGEGQPRHIIDQVAFAAAVCTPVDLVAFDRNAEVGPPEFRAKCSAKLADMKAAGRGILVYSQDVKQIRRLADRGLVLDSGRSRVLAPDPFADLMIEHKAGRLAERRKRRRKRRRAGDD